MDIIAANWKFQGFKNMPKGPTAGAPGWYFDFPDHAGVVSYVVEKKARPLLPEARIDPYILNIRGRIVASSGAIFDYKTETFNTCSTPAHVRPLIMRNMIGEYDRWWSTAAVELRDGAFDLAVPIDPAGWTSVYGKAGNSNNTALKSFWNAFQSKSFLGLTFGGGCFYGHGVRMSSGSAKFELHSIDLE